jgi:hypothetical protein
VAVVVVAVVVAAVPKVCPQQNLTNHLLWSSLEQGFKLLSPNKTLGNPERIHNLGRMPWTLMRKSSEQKHGLAYWIVNLLASP